MRPSRQKIRARQNKWKRDRDEAIADAVWQNQKEKVPGAVDPGLRTMLSNQSHRNLATD